MAKEEMKNSTAVVDLMEVLKIHGMLDEEHAYHLAQRLLDHGVHVAGSLSPEMFLAQSANPNLDVNTRRLLMEHMNAAMALREHQATIKVLGDADTSHKKLNKAIAEVFNYATGVDKRVRDVIGIVSQDIEEMNVKLEELDGIVLPIVERMKSEGFVFDGKTWNVRLTQDSVGVIYNGPVPPFKDPTDRGKATGTPLIDFFSRNANPQTAEQQDDSSDEVAGGHTLNAADIPIDLLIEMLKTDKVLSCTRDTDTNLWEIRTVKMLPGEMEKFAKWAERKDQELIEAAKQMDETDIGG